MLSRTDFENTVRQSQSFKRDTKGLSESDISRALDLAFEMYTSGRDASFVIVFSNALSRALTSARNMSAALDGVYRTFPAGPISVFCSEIASEFSSLESKFAASNRILKLSVDFEHTAFRSSK